MKNGSWIKGKKVLLTNIWIENYSGSELNCLGIAKELIKRDADVEVATFAFGEPISDEYDKANIKVKVINKQKLDREKYDIIWAHHSVVLNKILFIDHIKADRIIFSSLGAKEVLETPPVYVNDLTCCLCNSNETKDKILMHEEARNCIVFPNYIDDEWKNNQHSNNCNKEIAPKNILIVSNHLAKELVEAKSMLEKGNIKVDIIGINHNFTLVTPEILDAYDVVVTIGKTVQYAMSQKTPVYCYDVYGGPGYLNKDNYEKSEYYNFSGRGFNKKNSKEITEEIKTGYQAAVNNTDSLFQIAIDRFDLERNMDLLLCFLSEQKQINWDKLLGKYEDGISRQSVVETRLFNAYRDYKVESENLRSTINGLKNESIEAKKRVQKYKNKVTSLENRIKKMENSKSWRYTTWLRK